MKGHVRRAALGAAWLIVAILISLGGAGLVTGMAREPGTASRPELTWSGDTAIEPHLESAETDLGALTEDVRQLSDLGRGALSALVSRDLESLDQRVGAGEELALAIQLAANELESKLDGLPGIGLGQELRLSPDVIRRHDTIRAAVASTDMIVPSWTRLASGALAATTVSVLLTDHDTSTAAAAADGRAGRYEDALGKLDESDRLIADARRLADTLSATVDVSTLRTWLDLNADYDAALRRLYQAIVDANGRVNNEVRAAFAAEAEAKERLPEDTRAVTIILLDVARERLNGAVIAIEEARAGLEAALGALDDADPNDQSAAPS
jgi:hypothetical protein